MLGAFIKQVQLVLSDPRCHDLLELLRRDRGLSLPTMQDQTNSRRLAENIMGPDENIYRIDWVRHPASCHLVYVLNGRLDTGHEDDDNTVAGERRLENIRRRDSS